MEQASTEVWSRKGSRAYAPSFKTMLLPSPLLGQMLRKSLIGSLEYSNKSRVKRACWKPNNVDLSFYIAGQF